MSPKGSKQDVAAVRPKVPVARAEPRQDATAETTPTANSHSRRGQGGAGTREALYAAMVDSMYLRGYEGTAVRAVAEAVGVRMGSLYYHFPSKQQVLVEVMQRTLADLTADVTAALDKAGSAVEDRLRAIIRAHIRFHAERRKEAFIADSELRSLTPENRELIGQLRDQYEQIFASVIAEGMRTGEFDIPDMFLARTALLAMCTEVAAWFRADGRLTVDTIADVYADLFLSGVKPRPSSPSQSRRRQKRIRKSLLNNDLGSN